ncbi:unnamed protein product, partial [Phaeothamnion confervicola]
SAGKLPTSRKAQRTARKAQKIGLMTARLGGVLVEAVVVNPIASKWKAFHDMCTAQREARRYPTLDWLEARCVAQRKEAEEKKLREQDERRVKWRIRLKSERIRQEAYDLSEAVQRDAAAERAAVLTRLQEGAHARSRWLQANIAWQ